MANELEDNRPHPNCYWVEPGRLLAGEYPGASRPDSARKKVRALLDAGVNFFLDLTELGESTGFGALEPYADLLVDEAGLRGVTARHCRMAIRDISVPEPASAMADILDTIDAEIAGGSVIYVHCWGGIGRTGTVVGCYLVRRGESGASALTILDGWWQTVEKAYCRPRSPETDEQCAFVRNWSQIDPGTRV